MQTSFARDRNPDRSEGKLGIPAMAKSQSDQTVFSQIRSVFARAGLDDGEILEASITMVAVFARVLGVPRDQVLEMLDERITGAARLDPREQGWV
jgi:hypothetical protein